MVALRQGNNPDGWNLNPATRVEAVIFDLDDTLIPQAAWLHAAAENVAELCEQENIAERDAMLRAMLTVLNEGSDKGRVIDRALLLAGAVQKPETIKTLVDHFMNTRVPHLPTYPGAREILQQLQHNNTPTVILTDGREETQLGKIEDAHLKNLASIVVVTDTLGGRQARKPNPLGIHTACAQLQVNPEHTIMIGDRPDKDTACARESGAQAWRILTGEHKHAPDTPAADKTFTSLWECGQALGLLPPQ